MNSHFAESYTTNLHTHALSPLSWCDPVRHQFLYSFAASEILRLCLLVVCFFDRHVSLPFFLIGVTAVEAPFDFARNKCLFQRLYFSFNCLLKFVRQTESRQRGVGVLPSLF